MLIVLSWSYWVVWATLCPLQMPYPSDNRPAPTYRCENGRVRITSDAPLELIEAQSNKLRGIINTEAQTFAWSIDVKSLEGFNNPLQREHFNENYLESEKHPTVSFAGKIIEKIDFSKNGVYTVRAKGNLLVHGIEQERIIKSQLEVKDGALKVSSQFSILLADHEIAIPKIVYQKIAEEITVQVDATLK